MIKLSAIAAVLGAAFTQNHRISVQALTFKTKGYDDLNGEEFNGYVEPDEGSASSVVEEIDVPALIYKHPYGTGAPQLSDVPEQIDGVSDGPGVLSDDPEVVDEAMELIAVPAVEVPDQNQTALPRIYVDKEDGPCYNNMDKIQNGEGRNEITRDVAKSKNNMSESKDDMQKKVSAKLPHMPKPPSTPRAQWEKSLRSRRGLTSSRGKWVK